MYADAHSNESSKNSTIIRAMNGTMSKAMSRAVRGPKSSSMSKAMTRASSKAMSSNEQGHELKGKAMSSTMSRQACITQRGDTYSVSEIKAKVTLASRKGGQHSWFQAGYHYYLLNGT